ncbi:MAG: class I SAM-dependent methyltransferase [Planctomycetaceae bacterium]|nr:class I SAM-dependent methyltransferase [Planctomycetaceae bacterium]
MSTQSPLLSRRGSNHRLVPLQSAGDSGVSTHVNTFDRALARWILKGLWNPPVTIVLWNGDEFHGTDTATDLRVIFKNRRSLWETARKSTLGFGDGYTRGDIDVEGDLDRLISAIFLARPAAPPHRKPWREWKSPHIRKQHSLQTAKECAVHHYDIGNDFYRLWLGTDLVYTCAYYREDSLTLDEAQTAKMDHVCRKVQLQPGETVYEAGCGWGSLALHMAKNYGVKVRAFNISDEQIALAQEQARQQGLEHLVEFIEDDFRNIEGECDAFISVGMLEHIGTGNYAALGEVMARTLKPNGYGLIHSIGQRISGQPLDPWIESRIFPGAYTPSLREIMEIMEPAGLNVLDVENLRLHYARTLRDWSSLFERNADRIRSMYNDAFVRLWRLYLAGSIAAFEADELQLYQVLCTPARNNHIPWTREHLYRPTNGEGA